MSQGRFGGVLRDAEKARFRAAKSAILEKIAFLQYLLYKRYFYIENILNMQYCLFCRQRSASRRAPTRRPIMRKAKSSGLHP
jgi:hypothetical protein